MKLFRVFPYDASAREDEPGGALFLPAGGMNRIDNPDLYRTFYAAEQPEAAIGESFGRFPIWRPVTFTHPDGRPYALATYDVDDLSRFNLDDVAMLQSIGITRPTDVVARDRERTQAWARSIYERGRFAGIRWWSFYHPAWYVVGLWQIATLRLRENPRVITTTAPEVLAAAATITRQITN